MILDPDYCRCYTQARIVAWQYGWAIAFHGSGTRDLDLGMIPWTDNAAPAEGVVRRIADVTGTEILDKPGQKPYGVDAPFPHCQGRALDRLERRGDAGQGSQVGSADRRGGMDRDDVRGCRTLRRDGLGSANARGGARMSAALRTALSRLLRAAKDANSWSQRIDGANAVRPGVIKAAAQALEADSRAPATNVDDMLDRLDEIARGVCPYDYGLPLAHEDAREAMRAVLLERAR